jgi:hypothetical protein
MKRITICSVIVILSLLSFTHAESTESQKAPLPPAQIVRLDPRFDQLVPADAVVEGVARVEHEEPRTLHRTLHRTHGCHVHQYRSALLWHEHESRSDFRICLSFPPPGLNVCPTGTLMPAVFKPSTSRIPMGIH